MRDRPETVLSGTVLLLVSFGVVMVYSATSATALLDKGDPTGLVKRQLLYAVLGLAVFLIAARARMETLRRIGPAALVVSGIGRVFMGEFDCPFRAIDHEVTACPLKRGAADAIIVDFHAEATSEKEAMGYYLDGRASCVVGTHTHAPTADDRILPGGTAYMSDVGMCGDYNSVLGMDIAEPMNRFLTRIPRERFEPALGPATLSGLAVEIDGARAAANAEFTEVSAKAQQGVGALQDALARARENGAEWDRQAGALIAIGREAIEIYRTANRSKRNTPAPRHFSQDPFESVKPVASAALIAALETALPKAVSTNIQFKSQLAGARAQLETEYKAFYSDELTPFLKTISNTATARVRDEIEIDMAQTIGSAPRAEGDEAKILRPRRFGSA